MHLTRGGAQVTLLISSLVGNCQPRDALTEVGRWRAQPAGRSSWSALTSESEPKVLLNRPTIKKIIVQEELFFTGLPCRSL